MSTMQRQQHIFAIDTSGSTSENYHYYRFVLTLLNSLHSDDDTIILFNHEFNLVSLDEAKMHCSRGVGHGGSSIVEIPTALVCMEIPTATAHLIIVSDNHVEDESRLECEQILLANGVTFGKVSVFVICTHVNPGTSVASAFCRDCEHEVYILQQQDITDGMDINTLVPVRRARAADVENWRRVGEIKTRKEFEEKKEGLENAVRAKMIGRGKDEEVVEKLTQLQTRLEREESEKEHEEEEKMEDPEKFERRKAELDEIRTKFEQALDCNSQRDALEAAELLLHFERVPLPKPKPKKKEQTENKGQGGEEQGDEDSEDAPHNIPSHSSPTTSLDSLLEIANGSLLSFFDTEIPPPTADGMGQGYAYGRRAPMRNHTSLGRGRGGPMRGGRGRGGGRGGRGGSGRGRGVARDYRSMSFHQTFPNLQSVEDYHSEDGPTFQCPITLDEERDAAMLLVRGDGRGKEKGKEGRRIQVNPLNLMNSQEVFSSLISTLDHLVSFNSLKEYQKLNNHLLFSPLTRQPLVTILPLSPLQSHVSLADDALAIITGVKETEDWRKDLLFGCVWSAIHNGTKKHLTQYEPFFREQLIWRFRNHNFPADLRRGATERGEPMVRGDCAVFFSLCSEVVGIGGRGEEEREEGEKKVSGEEMHEESEKDSKEGTSQEQLPSNQIVTLHITSESTVPATPSSTSPLPHSPHTTQTPSAPHNPSTVSPFHIHLSCSPALIDIATALSLPIPESFLRAKGELDLAVLHLFHMKRKTSAAFLASLASALVQNARRVNLKFIDRGRRNSGLFSLPFVLLDGEPKVENEAAVRKLVPEVCRGMGKEELFSLLVKVSQAKREEEVVFRGEWEQEERTEEKKEGEEKKKGEEKKEKEGKERTPPPLTISLLPWTLPLPSPETNWAHYSGKTAEVAETPICTRTLRPFQTSREGESWRVKWNAMMGGDEQGENTLPVFSIHKWTADCLCELGRVPTLDELLLFVQNRAARGKSARRTLMVDAEELCSKVLSAFTGIIKKNVRQAVERYRQAGKADVRARWEQEEREQDGAKAAEPNLEKKTLPKQFWIRDKFLWEPETNAEAEPHSVT
ncbi:hypothetical protein BLNAU_6655 [Blattamonas nauphoetae]|uniref:Uncharacterized protein n=1 Tax=Blattamonas nauphoetae TaxID=2049346 RepID=A0ABQ9Y3V6_9EUKA|nr:hypothetical protein BLNAU_6655 [Blattamonas nauphoetae]